MISDYRVLVAMVEKRLEKLERNVDDQSPEFIVNHENARDLVIEIQLYIAGRALRGEDFWHGLGIRSFRLGMVLAKLGIPWDEQKAAVARRRAGPEAAGKAHQEKGDDTEDQILTIALELLDAGYGQRDIASIIAERIGLSVRQIRNHLKNARKKGSLPT